MGIARRSWERIRMVHGLVRQLAGRDLDGFVGTG